MGKKITVYIDGRYGFTTCKFNYCWEAERYVYMKAARNEVIHVAVPNGKRTIYLSENIRVKAVTSK